MSGYACAASVQMRGSSAGAQSQVELFGISFGEIGGILFMLVVALVVVACPASRICRRAGFPPLSGILSVMPVVNIGPLIFIAFAEWPAHVER